MNLCTSFSVGTNCCFLISAMNTGDCNLETEKGREKEPDPESSYGFSWTWYSCLYSAVYVLIKLKPTRLTSQEVSCFSTHGDENGTACVFIGVLNTDLFSPSTFWAKSNNSQWLSSAVYPGCSDCKLSWDIRGPWSVARHGNHLGHIFTMSQMKVVTAEPIV